MKKLCFVLLLGFIFSCIFSCKKNNNSSNNSNNNNTPTLPVTSFSIDGHSVGDSISHSSFANGNNFAIIAYKTGGGPELQITFSSSLTPTYGTYSITTGTPTYGLCTFVYSDTGYTSSAAHGQVSIHTGSVALSNTATFTNISVSGSAGGHTISGTIAY